MIKALHVIILLMLIVFEGCSVKHQITHSEPYLITIKTPQMSFSDTGFLNQAQNYTQLQIFGAGTLLLNLEIQESICLDGTCMGALAFNNRFFGTEHYAHLLNDIVHKKPLYEGQNYTKTQSGFTQEILLPNAHIFYKVEGEMCFFKETQHAVLIRLKPLP